MYSPMAIPILQTSVVTTISTKHSVTGKCSPTRALVCGRPDPRRCLCCRLFAARLYLNLWQTRDGVRGVRAQDHSASLGSTSRCASWGKSTCCWVGRGRIETRCPLSLLSTVQPSLFWDSGTWAHLGVAVQLQVKRMAKMSRTAIVLLLGAAMLVCHLIADDGGLMATCCSSLLLHRPPFKPLLGAQTHAVPSA